MKNFQRFPGIPGIPRNSTEFDVTVPVHRVPENCTGNLAVGYY